jgi:serralysin
MSVAYRVILEGSQEVPARHSNASGLGTIIFDDSGIAVFASYSINIEGIDFGSQTGNTADDVTGMHFHRAPSGSNGPIVFGLIPNQDIDDRSIVLNADHSWTVSGAWELSDPASTSLSAFAAELGSATVGTEVNLYFNVHTEQFPSGEIRGQLVAIADDNDNTVEGTAGSDLLPGLDGNDAILGFDGDDTLQGGNGRDTLDGGKGADVLNGGTESDILTGGPGPDLFLFNADFGHDIITDLESQDQIQFEDGLFPDSLAVLAASQQIGDNVVIRLDNDNTVTLLDTKLSSLQLSDFVTS